MEIDTSCNLVREIAFKIGIFPVGIPPNPDKNSPLAGCTGNTEYTPVNFLSSVIAGTVDYITAAVHPLALQNSFSLNKSITAVPVFSDVFRIGETAA